MSATRLLRYGLGLSWMLGVTTSWAQMLPPSWFAIRTPAADQYEVTMAGDAAFEGWYGASVRLVGNVSSKYDFGGLIQASRADAWLGKRLAMRAWIRTESADGAHMWLRIDAADRFLALDNMERRAVVGTSGWALYEIVMDVPQDAAYLVYGVFLEGAGRMVIDNIQFAAATDGAKPTTVYKENQLKLKQGQVYTPPSTVLETPSNLGFEQITAP
jgi:hypothetical protein